METINSHSLWKIVMPDVMEGTNQNNHCPRWKVIDLHWRKMIYSSPRKAKRIACKDCWWPDLRGSQGLVAAWVEKSGSWGRVMGWHSILELEQRLESGVGSPRPCWGWERDSAPLWVGFCLSLGPPGCWAVNRCDILTNSLVLNIPTGKVNNHTGLSWKSDYMREFRSQMGQNLFKWF